ncbi:UNKNOWN [Stylonychia lemnae]|uniref:Uncharacterized protein n=1 Tax=Stylonychia lemnae TaxID=5949 RepID=A0A077ZYP9_STYLE|nr:UNKNOWN [Stylonychia lemnae]|eukprot:CDW75020.1 UNKNOWN [Stylonychia lemnae]
MKRLLTTTKPFPPFKMIDLQEIKNQRQISIQQFDANVKNQLFYLNKIFETNQNSKILRTQFEDFGEDEDELFKAYENLNIHQIRRLSKIDMNQLRNYAKSLSTNQKNTVNFIETPIYESSKLLKAQTTQNQSILALSRDASQGNTNFKAINEYSASNGQDIAAALGGIQEKKFTSILKVKGILDPKPIKSQRVMSADPRKKAFFKNLDRITEASEIIENLRSQNEQSIKFLKILRQQNQMKEEKKINLQIVNEVRKGRRFTVFNPKQNTSKRDEEKCQLQDSTEIYNDSHSQSQKVSGSIQNQIRKNRSKSKNSQNDDKESHFEKTGTSLEQNTKLTLNTKRKSLQSHVNSNTSLHNEKKKIEKTSFDANKTNYYSDINNSTQGKFINQRSRPVSHYSSIYHRIQRNNTNAIQSLQQSDRPMSQEKYKTTSLNNDAQEAVITASQTNSYTVSHPQTRQQLKRQISNPKSVGVKFKTYRSRTNQNTTTLADENDNSKEFLDQKLYKVNKAKEQLKVIKDITSQRHRQRTPKKEQSNKKKYLRMYEWNKKFVHGSKKSREVMSLLNEMPNQYKLNLITQFQQLINIPEQKLRLKRNSNYSGINSTFQQKGNIYII